MSAKGDLSPQAELLMKPERHALSPVARAVRERRETIGMNEDPEQSVTSVIAGALRNGAMRPLEHFPGKREPLSVAEMRQIKGLQNIRDSMKRECSLEKAAFSSNVDTPPVPSKVLENKNMRNMAGFVKTGRALK